MVLSPDLATEASSPLAPYMFEKGGGSPPTLVRHLDHSLAELTQSYNPLAIITTLNLILTMTSRLCRDLQERDVKDDTTKVN